VKSGNRPASDLGTVVPRKISTVNNDTTDRVSVPADPLCRRMNNNIGAVCDGVEQVSAHSERVVNDEWYAVYISPSYVLCRSWPQLQNLAR
jgi:hypothetical protein